MQPKYRYLWAALVLAVGCSNDNGVDTGGVDPSEQVNALTPAQATSLCEAWKSQFPDKTVDCGSAGTTTIGYGSNDCAGSDAVKVPPPSCTYTVGEAGDCLAALYAGSAACNFSQPAACVPLADPNCD